MRLKSSRVHGSELSGDTSVQEYMTKIIVHIIGAEEKAENQSVITCRCQVEYNNTSSRSKHRVTASIK